MTEDVQILGFKKIEYAPDWVKTWMRPLVQIELSSDNEIFLFPDFENIFSRSKSVKEWWFLPPENNGCPIYQRAEYIDIFWNNVQSIYDSSILLKVSSERHKNLFLGFETTGNFLVNSLLRNMATVIDRTDSDKKDSEFSICYYYNFFHDVGAGKYWRCWLISKATIDYYHAIFAPKLNQEDNSREVLRLSNRFPEYERAVEYLKRVRETLYLASPCDREKTDRFFELQLEDKKKEVLAAKKPIGKYVAPFYCQCRVCGLIFMSPIKIAGKGKGKGQAKKICSSQNCEKAWDVFRNSLPLIPNDSEGRKISLSYL